MRPPSAVLLALALGAAVPAAVPTVQAQSYVVTNARVYTVDDARPRAEAFAVVNGSFATVGSAAAVRRAHPDLPVHDLAGATVTPGLIDAHGHLMGLAMTSLTADLVGSTSTVDVVARLQRFAEGRAGRDVDRRAGLGPERLARPRRRLAVRSPAAPTSTPPSRTVPWSSPASTGTRRGPTPLP